MRWVHNIKDFISPSSFFSSFFLLWVICYPLNYCFIKYVGVAQQLPVGYGPSDLNMSLGLSFFAFLVFIGCKILISGHTFLPGQNFEVNNQDILISLLLPLAAFLIFLSSQNLWSAELGYLNDAISIRNASTTLFFMVDLIIPSTMLFIALYDPKSFREKLCFGAVLLILLGISFYLGQVFYSRRYLAMPLMALLVHLLIKNGKHKFLILITVFSITLSPLFNQIRALTAPASPEQLTADRFLDGEKGLGRNKLEQAKKHFLPFLQSVSSTYEGSGHLAQLVSMSKNSDLLWGIDKGLSNVFNLGLSNVPRRIWKNKPELSGSIYQQSVLYPESAKNPNSMSTFPSGYIVDFMFGFGVWGILLFSLLFAWLFSTLDNFLNAKKSVCYFLAIFAFVNLFNFFRGGTAYIGNFLSPVFMIFIVVSVKRIRLSF